MKIIEQKAQSFDRTIAMRNLMEYIAGVFVAVLFGWMGWRSRDALIRTGYWVVAATGVWIIYYLRRYGKNRAAADPSQNVLEFTRALVSRYDDQIRLLKTVKYWYLLPLYAGLWILTAGQWEQRSGQGRLGWLDLIGPLTFTAVFAMLWWLNESYAVGRLRNERAKILAMTEAGEVIRRDQ